MAKEEEEVDISNLTDEEFLALDESDYKSNRDDTMIDADESASDDESEEEEDQEGSEEEEEEEEEEGQEEESEVNDDDGDESESNEDEEAEQSEEDDDSAEEGEEDSSEESEEEDESDDAKFAAIGREIMKEFVANGKPMKVKSAEDAIRLMQMGANYHKKMNGMKPAMKSLKLLEKHGLLDDSKLNFLIDLHEKKPEAIAQLLKDSKIDPMDIDVDGDKDYVPQKRNISDKEVMIAEAFDGVAHTASYTRLLNVIGEEWDTASQKSIGQQPNWISILSGHMESGIYDQVVEAVDYQKNLGNLTGVSDFDAYQQMGDYMHQNNLFKGQSSQSSGKNEHQDADESQNDADGESAAKKAARKNKKKAASSSRQGSSKKGDGDGKYNPLSMPDEEFAKKFNVDI